MLAKLAKSRQQLKTPGQTMLDSKAMLGKQTPASQARLVLILTNSDIINAIHSVKEDSAKQSTSVMEALNGIKT